MDFAGAITFIPQLAIFLAVYVFLSILVFRPYLRVHLKREELTIGRREKAERIRSEAEAKNSKLVSEMTFVHRQAAEKVESARREARRREVEILSDARKRARDIYLSKLKEMKAEADRTQKELEKELEEYGELIERKLLG